MVDLGRGDDRAYKRAAATLSANVLNSATGVIYIAGISTEESKGSDRASYIA